MAMTVYTITNSKLNKSWSATMDSTAGSTWVADCESKNLWGFPQRTISPDLQGNLTDWDGSSLNSADAISTVTITDRPAIAAIFASYAGILEGVITSVTITAQTAGANGNVSLSCDGKTDLINLISAWNSANSANQLTLSGDGTQIPSVGSVSLTGGQNAIAAVIHTGYVFAAQYVITSTVATQAQDPNWVALRAKRDQLLSLCDWIICNDSPIDSVTQGSWKTYRTSLRNLPANTSDATNPTWPTPPSSPLIQGINE